MRERSLLSCKLSTGSAMSGGGSGRTAFGTAGGHPIPIKFQLRTYCCAFRMEDGSATGQRRNRSEKSRSLVLFASWASMAHRARTSPVFGELRPSQIITTFGPGSVVDLRNVSVIVGGTDFWVTQPDQQIDEPRLLSMLRVRHLYRPAVRSDGGAAGVPAFIFPQYLFCPRCRRLGRYDRADLFYLDRTRFRCKA